MKNKSIYLLLVCYTIISVLTIIFFDGTGDAGDSIHHYLFAKYAPNHPALYFNHWAKPMFVLLASPFAQIGFVGVKIFNALVALISVFFTCKTIQKLKIPQPLIGSIILICTPLWFVLTYSGLTEPLFALFTIIGIYLVVQNRTIAACILISFLPFVRSEGLIIMGSFGVFLLITKNWKLIPLLLVGNFIYAFVGFFHYGDFLWVFTKNPYAKMSSTYGSGDLFYFVEQLYYVIGLPIYVLFWIGVLISIKKIIKNKFSSTYHILIFLSFFLFFTAHTIFWYLGIFNSMGLKRVLISVAPLSSIIALVGYNFITTDVFKHIPKGQKISKIIVVALIVVFPFTSNPAAIDWKNEMSLNEDQKTAQIVVEYINDHLDKDRCFYYAHPYLSEVLSIDHFDHTIRGELKNNFIAKMDQGDLLIWENWFAPIEFGVSKTFLNGQHNLKPVYTISTKDDGRTIEYIVYEKK